MKNTMPVPKRYSWCRLALIVGHLAIIGMLSISALKGRKAPVLDELAPILSILDCRR